MSPAYTMAAFIHHVIENYFVHKLKKKHGEEENYYNRLVYLSAYTSIIKPKQI